jgi:hypothetical protein
MRGHLLLLKELNIAVANELAEPNPGGRSCQEVCKPEVCKPVVGDT